MSSIIKPEGKSALPVGFKTDPYEDEEAIKKLVTAKIRLLLTQPFFGNMAARLILVNGDAWLSTAATDGRHFYYNSKFILSLDDAQNVFLFGHEILHNAWDHMDRNEGRRPDIANIACDYAVNGDLIQNRIGKVIDQVPILHETKYYGWSMEQIYADLMENAERIDLPKLAGMVLDDHLDVEDEDGEGAGSGKGKAGGKDGKGKGRPKPLTKEERDEIKAEVRDSIRQSAAACEAGDIPAGIQSMLDDWNESKIDWREMITASIQGQVKSNFTFQRPSRKGWELDAILPGMEPEPTVNVHVAVDMSGSMTTEMGKEIFGEIHGIMEQYTDYKVTIWTFDTQVYGLKEFTQYNGDELKDYMPAGNGGTEFSVNWDFMKENEIEPDILLFFTDGYPWGSWGDEDYCDTVFIIHGEGAGHITAPFGQTCHYDGIR
jgi:predicted metal-dependent peptidase